MRKPGTDNRGSNKDRRRRKQWMLSHFGDGVICRCTHCRKALNRHNLEADRIEPGGSYRHSNIQPACRRCNLARGSNPNWQYNTKELSYG